MKKTPPKNPSRGPSDGERDPEGVAQAEEAMDRIVGENESLGDLIDWDDREPEDAKVDEEVEVPRTRAGSKAGHRGSGSFNMYPADHSGPWFPVLLLMLPIDPAPRIRGQHGESFAERYFAEALWRTARWADLAVSHRAPSTHLMVLTDGWPLPPHPSQQRFPVERFGLDRRGMPWWPSTSGMDGGRMFVGGRDSLHHVLGGIVRHVPGLLLHVHLTPARGERVRLARRPAADWPIGW